MNEIRKWLDAIGLAQYASMSLARAEFPGLGLLLACDGEGALEVSLSFRGIRLE
jgi:hypothetical protein